MTNQELLSGFLDRSLSEDQLLEFEKRQLESPEFAQEVREMLTVEDLLTDSSPRVRYPIEFLASVESSVAAKVVAGAAAAGILGTLTKSVWAWIASGAAVAVTGGAIYYAAQQAPESAPTPAPVSEKSTGTAIPAAPQVDTPVETTPEPLPIKEVTRVDVDAKATTTNTVMDQLRADYESCAIGKDPVRCSQLALQLGRKYRQIGQGADAQRYLQAAVDNARSARLAQFEIDGLGELGLLAKSRGNVADAKSYFERAVERAGSARLTAPRWQNELEQIANQ
jgi:hypothetical protein